MVIGGCRAGCAAVPSQRTRHHIGDASDARGAGGPTVVGRLNCPADSVCCRWQPRSSRWSRPAGPATCWRHCQWRCPMPGRRQVVASRPAGHRRLGAGHANVARHRPAGALHVSGCCSPACRAAGWSVVDAPQLYRRAGNPHQSPEGTEWLTTCGSALLGWLARPCPCADPSLAATTGACARLARWHGVRPWLSTGRRGPHRSSPSTTWLPGLVSSTIGLAWPVVAVRSSPAGPEFHGSCRSLKAGLKFARRVTTVSPDLTPARSAHEFGCGLDGVVIRGRGQDAGKASSTGSIRMWNPATDDALAHR